MHENILTQKNDTITKIKAPFVIAYAVALQRIACSL